MQNDIIIKKLNTFFKKDLIELYNLHKNIKSRNRKLTITDIVKYLFYYAKKDNTKQFASQKANMNVSRSSFYNKLKTINITFFEDLFERLKMFRENMCKNDDEINILNNSLSKSIEVMDKDNILFENCPVDGTCNNNVVNGVLVTDSNVHVYNNSKKEPCKIVFNNLKKFDNNINNVSNKNGEIALFEQFIDSTDQNELKKKIFIFDRAYASYVLIKKLTEKNIKYVIRLKENFTILDATKKSDKNNTEKINKILENDAVRIIKNTITVDNIFTLNVSTKKKVTTVNNYYLITNLGDAINYSDALINKLYESRWEIEVFFKKTKSSFKYELFRIDDDNEIIKMKHISNIIFVLMKILTLIALKYNYKKSMESLNPIVQKRVDINKLDKRRKKDKRKYDDYLKCKTYDANVTINFEHFYNIFCDGVLDHLVNGKLKMEHICILNKSIIINKDKKNRKFERKSLIPFTKWYVKMYHKFYKDRKIYDALIYNDTSKLDKNLKVIAERIIKNIISHVSNESK